MKSNLCNWVDFLEPEFKELMLELGKDPNKIHRKHWEYYYIVSNLRKHMELKPGLKGLVFGAGKEILPSYFASLGIQITATDKTDGTGWDHNGQHSKNKEDLYFPEVIHQNIFSAMVQFESCDMNDIPEKYYDQFDFVWSTCSLEHIGGLKQGLTFIDNSIKCLKPGGVAIHTTEFNLSSNDNTINAIDVCFYRKKDLEYLENKYEFKFNYNFDFSDNREDNRYIVVDMLGYLFTSIGLTLVK